MPSSTPQAATLPSRDVVQGLRIPGSAPALLEKDPLKIDASMRIKDPARPLTVAATHRLFSLNANAVTAGQQNVEFVLKLPSIVPFAALAGEALNGDATVKGRIERRESDMGLSLDADATLAGGGPSWAAMVGNRVALGISGALSDTTFTVEHLKLAGNKWSLSASGSAERPASGRAGGEWDRCTDRPRRRGQVARRPLHARCR